MNKEEFIKEIGSLFRKEREKRGLKQYQISEKCDLSKPTIVNFENGTSNPTLDVLYNYAKAMDLKMVVGFEPFEQKNCVEDYQKKAIDKAKSLGFETDDYDLAMNFIMNNDNSKPLRIEAESFSGFTSSGNLKFTLPILGKRVYSGEFYSSFENGEISEIVWDADGSKYEVFYDKFSKVRGFNPTPTLPNNGEGV